MRMLLKAAALLAWLVAGCLVPTDDELNQEKARSCDAEHPCLTGYACVEGHCQPEQGTACRPGTSTACGAEVGECQPGKRMCGADGTYGPCEGGVSSGNEVCNGLDDDCDGTEDEGLSCCDACPAAGRTCVKGQCVACLDSHVEVGTECRPKVELGGSCTEDRMCGSGFCVGGFCCNSACDSPPMCRGAGVCSTGACTYPIAPNVACEDGNGCTLNDKCDASGVCMGGTAKVCNTAPGACYGSAGTCNGATGACEYPPLPNTTACNDNNNCTTADRCNGSGVCVGGTAKVCISPPGQCYANMGTCNPGSGACEYPALSNTTLCDDGNKCTGPDRCNGSGTCAGTPKVCNSAPGQCYASTGTCNTGTGNCDYPALSNTTSCDDGKACTSPDKCDGLGSCASTMSCPPPNECRVASTSVCVETGACVFEVNTAQVGKVCNEGGKTGTCSPDGSCLRFNYAVTPNFNPETIADGRTINDLTVSCAATLDTSGTTPTWSDSGCGFSKPTSVVLGSLVVVAVRNLVVDAPLRLTGTRSVIFAVYGNATLNAEIRANSLRTETLGGAGSGLGCTSRVGTAGSVSSGDGSGGGGGGLATAGGRGGDNDDSTGSGGFGGSSLAAGFSPLAGGCAGGDGGTPAGLTTAKGGAGGGSVQISVAGTLTVRNGVTVNGAGGKGGQALTGKTAGGGGGGGSGGLLVLEADSLVVESTAILTANGGGGGEGGGESGGAYFAGYDGSDGRTTSSLTASGGSGSSTWGGDGGAGAAGSTNPANAFKGSGTHGAGGGGGGAAGRILLRGVTSCSAIPSGSVISPAYDKTSGVCAAP